MISRTDMMYPWWNYKIEIYGWSLLVLPKHKQNSNSNSTNNNRKTDIDDNNNDVNDNNNNNDKGKGETDRWADTWSILSIPQFIDDNIILFAYKLSLFHENLYYHK